jgi:hypothetical protein
MIRREGAISQESAMRTSFLPALILASLTAASCGVPGAQSAPQPLTEKQSATLTKALAGRTAGPPVDCITSTAATNFTRVSDDILLYRYSGRVVYKNTLPYTCPGLARDDDLLVFEPFGGNYCEGDLVRLVDRNSGIPGKTCRLGAFVPYKRTAG